MIIFEATPGADERKGTMAIDGHSVPCAFGKNGVIAAADKREGDGKSPAGTWPIRNVYWRADRGGRPITCFNTIAIEPNFGWCDTPTDSNYNRFVTHPYPVSAEHLWRDDELYDIIVELGHNDSPPVPFMGSAIFLHCAKPDCPPTEGCVALNISDLRRLLKIATPGSALRIIG
ncbi:MAG: L,D-transpeptidase family protein [Pseudomonadota bacterium]